MNQAQKTIQIVVGTTFEEQKPFGHEQPHKGYPLSD